MDKQPFMHIADESLKISTKEGTDLSFLKKIFWVQVYLGENLKASVAKLFFALLSRSIRKKN
jgi:hypothetical protein